jgi:hypothetical protein
VIVMEERGYLTVWQPHRGGTFRMFEESLDGSCAEVEMLAWP